MIVVAIIGLLSIIGLPNMLQAGQASRDKRFARNVVTAAHAFLQFSLMTGDYPPDNLPAQMPIGMEGYLSRFPWEQDTAIGGQWDWDYNVFGVIAGVSVKSPNRTAEQMRAIDEVIDDGSLDSGIFRVRSGGYIYVIEE